MPDSLAHVRSGYDRWAAVYDSDANPLPPLEEPLVRTSVGDARGLRVLDLGCGTGRHALWLAAAGANVTAVDFSSGMLDAARVKPGAERVEFVQLDLHEPLPYAEAFDLLVSGLVLEHVSDLPRLFSAAYATLKPGGRAVLSAMHPAMFLRGSQARFTDPDTGEVVPVGSLPHSISEFVMAALGGGFQISGLTESAPDADFAARFPRAEKYVGYPMVVVMSLERPPSP
ncbi:Malonyl-[acyl-carrier protein] O-methyltransferase [Posidoniimonas corsicana]|uniref:Malonyl-[acyl-carrier protein] O-methyltransferase n=1 Tax=Posidoniimonas corsicana TaxID=1938618 RepID=A0A5C5V4W8_9BACT|nr:class I SAM-dependent methyltransferase [Posidoniimonas corsicana]TWT33578.1 Malonyl-[acyl-carrier protein] O-methyltransferase [Posidoniimonas corsicana]